MNENEQPLESGFSGDNSQGHQVPESRPEQRFVYTGPVRNKPEVPDNHEFSAVPTPAPVVPTPAPTSAPVPEPTPAAPVPEPTPAAPAPFVPDSSAPTQTLPIGKPDYSSFTNDTQAGLSRSPYRAPNTVAPSVPKRSRRRGPGWASLILVALVVAVLTAGGTVGGLWAANLIGNQPKLVEAEAGNPTQVAPVVNSQAATADWKAVNEAVGKSVVLIQAISEDGEGGTGSGVIIDDKSHILTNYHVVARAISGEGSKLTVTLSDSRIYPAEVVGVDMLTDLAVIKLSEPAEGLTVARLGNSQNLFVGQQVAAIGAPLGLKSTMTTGIISALDRPTVVSDPKIFGEAGGAVFTNAIQVDASINPGNSGGPLFDAQGRVIGVNSSIMSITSTGQKQAGSIGLGFAIPVDLAKKVSSEIIKTGKVKHALIGIQVKAGYGKVGDERLTGAVVTEVQPSSKFKEAGLREGDVILSVDGKSVVDSSNLIGYIRRYSPGDSVTLQVARGGKRMEIRGQLMADK